MNKPYKDDHPENTITKIRNILNNLGIFLKEHYSAHDKLHACRVEIVNHGLNDLKKGIGTNGKGTSVTYAFASAYAEFMERIQNHLILHNSYHATRKYVDAKNNQLFSKLLEEKNAVLDFYMDPNEKIIKSEEFIESQSDFMAELLFPKDISKIKEIIINKLHLDDLVCVPFFDEKVHKTVYLPIDLLIYTCGSNGMCAGNTPEEAIIQGICEIFERYAIKQVNQNKLTPPTIPIEVFEDSKTIELVNRIEKNGLKLIIKDFSLGIGLPVIGVVFINPREHSYNVKVGSDPKPEIALQRCLTEAYQTLSDVRMLPIQGWEDFTTDSETNKYYYHFNFTDIFKDASGQWPRSIFGDTFSYKFQGFTQLGINHKDDLKYLMNCINKLGKKLYVRDVSFLGFNSYYIVIPGISNIFGKQSEDFISSINVGFWRRIKSINNFELAELVESIEKEYSKSPKHWEKHLRPGFLYHTNKDLSDMDLNLFLSMSYYKLNDLEKASFYLDVSLKDAPDEDPEDFLYFYACKDFFRLKREEASLEKIKHVLNTYYWGVYLLATIIELYDKCSP